MALHESKGYSLSEGNTPFLFRTGAEGIAALVPRTVKGVILFPERITPPFFRTGAEGIAAPVPR